ncbi:MAG: sigma 54-interacting transcriptional regulator [Magnetococcus sp. YQC-5]
MKANILIIDDDDHIIDYLQAILLRAGHVVAVETSYTAGLLLAKTHTFDLIYCDIMLSDGSGLDLILSFKQEKNPAYIIIMTGLPSLETVQTALRYGAFDYITKPTRPQDLLHSLENAMKHKVVHDEKERLHLRLEAVFRSVDSGILTFTTHGILESINETGTYLCGFYPDQQGIFFPINRPYCSMECRRIFSQVIDSKYKKSETELHCKRKDRFEQKVKITVAPLISEAKQSIGVVMVVEDETRTIQLKRNLQERTQFHRLIGSSPAMQAIFLLIEDLAEVESTALITGESGTGKELVMDAIHYQSRRAQKPLVKVNCSALSDTLLESELFGHVRGAFTGAIANRKGRFELAENGTLFLDEIGDISSSMQVSLLRILQEREYQRVGDEQTRKANFRVIAATNKNLREKMANHTFREDLYYRLNVVEVKMPSLRERYEDIPLLVDHFVFRFCAQFNKTITGVSDEVMHILMHHTWPGNVRELEHAIEHAFVRCRARTIERDHLPQELCSDTPYWLPEISTAAIPPVLLARVSEKESIIQALQAVQWNREAAARIMGMSRATFFRRMRQYDIKRL